MIDETSSVAKEQEPEIRKIEVKGTDAPIVEEKPVQPTQPPQCSHQLGYLSKRSPKEGIPEECIVCNNIVECMLKNVTG